MFPIEFLSQLTFIFTKQTFSISENIFIEGQEGKELYFIMTGRASLIHRRSKTKIIDLLKDSYFGEISFFTEQLRTVTIKTSDFSEVLILEREKFLSIASQLSPESLGLYYRLRDSVSFNAKDYK
jgi:CRP-like cAMP-binding protein